MARKILLADDSVTAQNMGRKILADAGYEVITVNNGSAALKKISEQKPDLIVLDVYMPGYSGLEVCQRVKEVGETSRIPILLTVGKLEPFKPEEAKRVRADGFIVKPFEASELLSALSKLEDRIVPRSETSKTGRFARATAAIDEGRYDKTVAADDEDSGWKNRISFPPKKKEKEKAVAEAEETPTLTPAKNDLRSATEHKVEPAPAVHTESVMHAEEKHVNLAALAPEGLPKDVTPEEIAALAAAAAQVKGKIAEEKPAAPLAEMAVNAPIEAEAPKIESKEVTPSAEQSPAPEATAAAQPPTTFAEHHTAEKIDEQKTEPEVVSTQADAMTAIMGLETQMFAVHLPTTGDGSGPNGGPIPAQEPATMAVAAPAYSGPPVSRWTAVSVALAPEDAPVSLEEEMQKAFAAAAAASTSQSTAVETVPEPVPTPLSSVATTEPVPVQAAVVEPAFPVDAPVAEAVTPAPPEVAPEAAESTAVTEAISAAVKELESVAASYVAEQAPAPVEAVTPQPFEAAETSAPSITENSPVQDVKAEITPVAEAAPVAEAKAEIVPEIVEAPVPQASHHDHSREEWSEARTEDVEAVSETAVPSPVNEPVPVSDVVEQQESEHEISAEPATAVSGSRIAGGTEDMAKRESETAAAWASWRKIRETGGPRSAASAEAAKESEESAPQDKAAMAVAVGAESSPEEVPGSFDSDPEIASIVDSVLADMRPKIVEEIARKLGKKK